MNFSKLLIKADEVDLVIYHGKCADGFGSALAAYIYFQSTNGFNVNGNKVEYFPASFNQEPPNVKGKNVLICDFSYKRDILLRMISDARTLAVIDHHKSAKLDLEDIPLENKMFDMNHSGAYLTWKYFYPDQDVPLLIKYIEDNDIWLKLMPNTKEMTSYVYSLPFEFEEYAKLLDENFITGVAIPTAVGMQKQNDYYVDQSMGQSTQKFIKIGNDYFLFAHINSSVLKSEIGNQILSKFPHCDFSAVYSVREGSSYFSLRSEDTRADVSLIAGNFGGGGHRNASGICVNNSTEIPCKLIDNDITYKLIQSGAVHIKEGSSIVFLDASHNIKHLGKYLLQTICTEKYGPEQDQVRPVQKCCSVERIYRNDGSFYSYCKVSVITTRCPNPLADTIYNLFWLDPNITKHIDKLFGNMKDANLTYDQMRMTFSASDDRTQKVYDKLKELDLLM